jgi:hypothetical protein
MTPDWAAKPTAVPYASFGNPQSLNLYGYVQNNPEAFVDPDGHWCIWGMGTTCNQAPPPPPPPSSAKLLSPPPKAHVDKNGNPSSSQPPSTPKWQYQQSTGITALKVDSLTVQPVKGGYSGHGQGLNDPESQSVGEDDDKANAGPIPQGTYSIGTWYDGPKGKPMARLLQDPGTEMFGRYDIEWHGDNRQANFTASEGCIVSPSMDTRLAVAGSGVTDLEVVP